MGYKTCYLCKHWSESTGICSKTNTVKSENDYCSLIELIPCCASCQHWSLNYDYLDKGNCKIHKGLSPATSICNTGDYKEKTTTFSDARSRSASYSAPSSCASSPAPKSKKGKWITITVILIVIGALILAGIASATLNMPILPWQSQKSVSSDLNDNYKPGTYYVTSEDGVELMDSPSDDAEVLLVIPYKETIEVTEIKNGWAKTKVLGKTGYCRVKSIAPEGKIDSKLKISCKYYDLTIPEYWEDNYVVEENDEYDEWTGVFHKLSVYENSSPDSKGYLFSIALVEKTASHFSMGYYYGELKADKDAYIHFIGPSFGEDSDSTVPSDIYFKMYQDIPNVLNTIHSNNYEIIKSKKENIKSIRDISEYEILSLAERLDMGRVWTYYLLQDDFRLDPSNIKNIRNDYYGESPGIMLPSAYGIHSADDLKIYLSKYFSENHINDCDFTGIKTEIEEYNNLYFGPMGGQGWFGWALEYHRIDYTSDTSLILHTNIAIPDEIPETKFDTHLYFVLEDGRLKLDKIVETDTYE